MQQTQPLSKSPGAAITTAPVQTVVETAPPQNETVPNSLAAVALVAVGVVAYLVYQVMQAAILTS
jgi:hypothetical protein